MRLFIGFVLLLLGSVAHAQDAIVVDTCGTPPTGYTAGEVARPTMDTTGKLCSSIEIGAGSGNVSASGTLTTGNIIVGGGTTVVQGSAGLGTTPAVATGGLSITKNPVIANGDAATALGLSWQQSISGTCSNAICDAHLIQANSINVTASSAMDVFRVNVVCCNVASTGSIQSLEADFTLNNTSGNSGTPGYVAFVASAQASVNDNGGSGTESGALFGADIKALLSGTATNWSSIRGLEIGYGVATGASVLTSDGLVVLLSGSNIVAGSLQNAGIRISNSVNTASSNTMTCGFCIGGYSGYNPFASTASVMTFLPHGGSGSGPSIANGIHFGGASAFTFSGNAFDSTGFAIDGTGALSLTGTTNPATAAGKLTLAGIATAPTPGGNGEGAMYLSSTGGLIIQGQGSTDDIRILNKSGTTVVNIATGASGVTIANGALNVARVQVTAATVASNGIYLPSANTVALSTNTTEAFRVTSAQIIQLTAITTDSAHTDATLCEDTTTHGIYFGSGTLGICLGTSSSRFKHDISDIDVGLKQIMDLHPISYFLNADHGDPNKLLYGFTAEQGGKVLPKLMTADANGEPNTFDYLGIVPVLVKAVQQQQAEIEQLKRRLH